MASLKDQNLADRVEKRKLPRFPVQLPAQLRHGPEDLSSICTNISTDGVSVETALEVGVGERLPVEVTIAPDEEPLQMMGQIVWRRGISAVDTELKPIFEIGIRFLRPLPSPWKIKRNLDMQEPLDENEVMDDVVVPG